MFYIEGTNAADDCLTVQKDEEIVGEFSVSPNLRNFVCTVSQKLENLISLIITISLVILITLAKDTP